METAAPRTVASAAARDALFPSPVPGNSVWRSDTLQQETYYAASGSPARPAGWYSGQDGGLVPIVPGSVSVGSGSATVSGNGSVTITNTANFGLLNIFDPSKFSAYRIVGVLQANSGTDVNIRFADSSGIISTAVYSYMGQFRNGTTKTEYAYNSQTSISGIVSTSQKTAVEIIVENTSGRPLIKISSWSNDNTLSYMYTIQGAMNYSTINTGMWFVPASGNVTGTIQVYGYRN